MFWSCNKHNKNRGGHQSRFGTQVKASKCLSLRILALSQVTCADNEMLNVETWYRISVMALFLSVFGCIRFSAYRRKCYAFMDASCSIVYMLGLNCEYQASDC